MLVLNRRPRQRGNILSIPYACGGGQAAHGGDSPQIQGKLPVDGGPETGKGKDEKKNPEPGVPADADGDGIVDFDEATRFNARPRWITTLHRTTTTRTMTLHWTRTRSKTTTSNVGSWADRAPPDSPPGGER